MENKSEIIYARLEPKLREQLERYCKHEDISISATARKALKTFLLENTTVEDIENQ